MNPYVLLGLDALAPAALSAILYAFEKRAKFVPKIPYIVRQLICGILFGGLAVFATEYGVPVVGVVMNVRDASPICAGLLFGSPAGIIAGAIGGVERYVRAYAVGEMTKLACSVATFFAGVFAAMIRKFMFENKKPSWYYGFATGVIIEVFHMLMVFLTNLSDTHTAFRVVQKCTVPMCLYNGASVMVAIIFVSLIGRNKIFKHRSEINISQLFQRKLLVCVIIAFVLTSGFTTVLQTGVSKEQTKKLLEINLEDVKNDVDSASDANLLATAEKVAAYINSNNDTSISNEELLLLISEEFDIAEINLVGEDGIIFASTDEEYIGFDMNKGEQSREFMTKLYKENLHSFVQGYQENTSDGIMRKYAAVTLYDGSFVQIAYDSVHFHRDIADRVVDAATNRHIGEEGYIIICDETLHVVSVPESLAGSKSKGKLESVAGFKLDAEKYKDEAMSDNGNASTVTTANIFGEDCYMMCRYTEGYYILAVRPASEADFARDIAVYLTVFMEVIIYTSLFLLVYFLIKNLVVRNIRRINTSLGQITGGNLDVTVDVRNSVEFASLSDDINSTVDTLKHYIDEAAARIDKELEFAKTIQASALPSVFPPYPNKTEFDIFASMKPAKEVGGDFYDFYMLGEDKIAFAVADVSGKGIPAAMFMMTSKTMLKSMAESGMAVNEVFTNANNELCESNDAGMFVTAWMGILDLKTGIVTYANAGHNPPLVRHSDGRFEYLKSQAGFVLAGMDGIRYKQFELQLTPGDAIFLYTDGVTEATDLSNELYGEERLITKLNILGKKDVETICHEVKADVDGFVGEAPQFDDITMVCLEYKKKTEDAKDE